MHSSSRVFGVMLRPRFPEMSLNCESVHDKRLVL